MVIMWSLILSLNIPRGEKRNTEFIVNFINSFRSSCAIGFEDKIVVTGGSDNSGTYGEPLARVTSYTYEGFLADLPEMNEARKAHGCTYFRNNDNKIVSLTSSYPLNCPSPLFCICQAFNRLLIDCK